MGIAPTPPGMPSPGNTEMPPPADQPATTPSYPGELPPGTDDPGRDTPTPGDFPDRPSPTTPQRM